MKKLFLITCFIVGFTAVGHAQFFKSMQNKRFFFGVRGGVNLSQLNTNSVVLSSGVSASALTLIQSNKANYTGWVGGIWMRLGHKVYIQPELLISAKGGKIGFFPAGINSQPITVDASYTNFDVPVLLGLKLGPVRLNAGPVASLAISENASFKDAINQYAAQNIKKIYQQASIGYQAGVGVDFGSFNLDLRYQGSFSDVVNQKIVQSGNLGTSITSKATLWQLTLGYVVF